MCIDLGEFNTSQSTSAISEATSDLLGGTDSMNQNP
jgi:hypothetical protein